MSMISVEGGILSLEMILSRCFVDAARVLLREKVDLPALGWFC